jgi:hypothetical protein
MDDFLTRLLDSHNVQLRSGLNAARNFEENARARRRKWAGRRIDFVQR